MINLPKSSQTDYEKLQFPYSRLTVREWNQEIHQQTDQQHSAKSSYSEAFWVSILGPTTWLLVGRLSTKLQNEPDGFFMHPGLWAQELGLIAKGGRHSPFWKSINRCVRFRLAYQDEDVLYVKTKLPSLSSQQILRLPPHLKLLHDKWLISENYSK